MVDRAADAEGEDARVRMLLHLRDYLHLVADVAVGHKADYPHVAPRVRRVERRLDGLHHLRAAAARARLKEALRLLKVLGRRGDWLVEEDVRVARKRDEVEGVLRVETFERELHRLLRLLDGEARHR